MMRFLLFGIFFFSIQLIFSQNAFKYQAVVRDNAGEVVANQSIGVQISIIQDNIANSASYVETHTTTSTAYGVININIGQGTVVSGTFVNLDWSKSSFAKIEIDITGGSSYVNMGTSELLHVPKALYAQDAGINGCPNIGLCVKDFGAVGDNSTDDTAAFQNALDSATLTTTGNKVYVPAGNYKITSSLTVPDGVTIQGEGMGNTPLGSPYNGSAIRYSGSGFAVKLECHNCGLKDMLVVDNNVGTMSASGVQILADSRLNESIRFEQVLIHNFTGGTALKLEAINAGGIPYASFYDVRIRNGKTGIHIYQDVGSFVNSNAWYHGVISGGGFDYGILVDGGNNNQFYGTIIEPQTSTYGHVVVNDGEIICPNIRIEGTNQPVTTPLVTFAGGTKNSFISGTYAGGLTIDDGNNFVGFRSGKAAHYFNSRANLYENATFESFDGTSLPYWDISGAGVTMAIEEPELTSIHNVLKLTVPNGVTANLEPSSVFTPQFGDLPLYGQLNFGMYIKVNVPATVYLRTNPSGGVTSSQAHHGDGNWHFVSMSQNVDTSQVLDAKLEIANASGASVDVYISVPTFNYGNQSPSQDPKPITSAGGIITGTLSTAMFSFTPSTTFIVLPKYANVFEITGTQAIHRINDALADRFPKGTIITLLFNDAGLNILNSVYLDLKETFSSVEDSSLTLVSNGDGTWRELWRNL